MQSEWQKEKRIQKNKDRQGTSGSTLNVTTFES